MPLRSRSMWVVLLGLASLALIVMHARAGAPPGEAEETLAVQPDAVHDPARAAEVERLAELVDGLERLDAATLVEQRALPTQSALGYDPLEAASFDLLQASELALCPEATELLAQHGFVIDAGAGTWSFLYGYEQIFRNDLPLFVSADSILHAVHRSFESLLAQLEDDALLDELDAMLVAMRARLAGGALRGFDEAVVRDTDLYLAVALQLLRFEPADSDDVFDYGGELPELTRLELDEPETQLVAPVGGADPAQLEALVVLALNAEGQQAVELFGSERQLDASQFAPRGHYTASARLRRYFRASMWLGRVDLRALETRPDGASVLQRRQLEAAAALTTLLEGDALAHHTVIDETLEVLVGESDSMTPQAMRALLDDLGAGDDVAGALARASDTVLLEALSDGDYGTQRIASRSLVHLPSALRAEPLPLDRSFALLGQRFAVDSMVLANVVYDRTATERLMPQPLDVAYAALGNDAAAALLSGELEAWRYAPQLEANRRFVDAYPPEFWQGSLYTLWLAALRALSPDREAIAAPTRAGLPMVAATEPWQRRVLNTQLASWAELRHDTLLYVKQSYSMSGACEYPDVYVEPSPRFFAALEAFAALGKTKLLRLDALDDERRDRLEAWLETLASTSATLREMAERQRKGKPLRERHLKWINAMVRDYREGGCGPGATIDTPGWYHDLFFDSDPTQPEPIVADVHTVTDPRAPGVLHVGTGVPSLMAITVDTTDGPRLYVGLVSSYYEHTTDDLSRLDDDEWRMTVYEAEPVAWTAPVRSQAEHLDSSVEPKQACGYVEDEDY